MVVRIGLLVGACVAATVGCAARTIDDDDALQGNPGDEAGSTSMNGESASDGAGGDDAAPATTGGDDGAASATASAGGDDGPVCAPGSTAECTCDNGQPGVSECAPTGDGYLPCACPTIPGIPDPDCDDVGLCPDCQFCASHNGCSEFNAACMTAPGCPDFRLCTEECEAEPSCILECADGLDPETTVVAFQWAECTVAACPNSCGV